MLSNKPDADTRSIVDGLLAPHAFDVVRAGFFAVTPGVRRILATGAFNVSNGAGDIFNYKRADFEYNGVVGPALPPHQP